MEGNNQAPQQNLSASATPPSVTHPSSLGLTPPPIKKFNFLMVVLFLFLLLATGGSGYYLGMQNGKSSQIGKLAPVATPIVAKKIPTPTPSPTRAPCMPGEPKIIMIGGKKHVIIKELGINFPVSNRLTDILYCVNRGVGRSGVEEVSVEFSTKMLASKDSYCSPEHSPIGSFSKEMKANLLPDDDDSHFGARTNKELKELTTENKESNLSQSAKEFPDFYILYVGPQATCTGNQEAIQLETDLIQDLYDVIPQIQLSK